jgi:hypothetical protein
VWGQNIRVVIFPLILAITYLGQSIDSHFKLISRFQSIASSTRILAGDDSKIIILVQGESLESSWGVPMLATSFALSMAVNTLVTGLIRFVFRILNVFLETKAATTSIERTLGTTVNGGYQTSAYHIHNDRIWYGVVCRPISSRRALQPQTSAVGGLRIC